MVRGALSVFKFFLQVCAILVITHVYYEIRVGQDFKKLERRLSGLTHRSEGGSSSEPAMELARQVVNQLVSMITQ
jgi:hypothetical protein